jgi:MFS transporter, DHA3 family, multidrug efflux protein
MSTTKTRALDLTRSADRAFVHLLVNTLLVSVINFTVWFAVTFWVFLRPSRCWRPEWWRASSW